MSDELRRKKNMAKRTQEQINKSKETNQNNAGGDSSKGQQTSSAMTATLGMTKTHNTAFVDGSPVDVLLFGFNKTD